MGSIAGRDLRRKTPRSSNIRLHVSWLVATLLLCGCAAPKLEKPATRPPDAKAAGMIQVMENKIALKIIGSAIDGIARADPEASTVLGAAGGNDQWDAPDGSVMVRRSEILSHYSDLMRQGADFSKLTPAHKVAAQLLEYGAKRAQDALAFRDYLSHVNPASGPQVRLPMFLITSQPVKTAKDAENYIARIRGFEPYVQELIAADKARRQQGTVLPLAGAETIAAECHELTNEADDGPLLDDLDTRMRQARLDVGTRKALHVEAIRALRTSLGPGCRQLADYARSLAGKPFQGAWSLSNGAAFYAERLAWYTSTDLNANAIQELAVQQLSRVTSGIEDVMAKEGFKGSPAEYLAKLRIEKDTRIADTDDAIQKWLNKVGGYILALQASLDDMTSLQPGIDLDIREMPAFKAASGEIAAYYDGSDLGIYFINLPVLPTYEAEAVTFRYSIPGQHLVNISPLNRIVPMPAFTEGWSLYSLALPLNFGYYKEPHTRLGRLLVLSTAIAEAIVDVGIHARHWSRPEATSYLLAHSPMSRDLAGKAIDRILAEPGRATAAVTGAATITRLEDHARQVLGSAFSQKAFNDAVLRYGPVTMPMLAGQVDTWLRQQQHGKIPSP